MLLGADIHVFTDQKNLAFKTSKMQQIMHWHNKVEEYSHTLHYMEGPHNILADNLSRFNCLVTPAQIKEGKSLVEPVVVSDDDEENAYFLEQECSSFNDDEIKEVFEGSLNLPENPHLDHNLLNYTKIY